VIVSKDHRVGIDVELVTPKVEKVKRKFLSNEELSNIQHSTFNIQHLTLLWCCKEAVFKWYGNGGVDFKDHILIKPFDINSDEGIINCEFVKAGKDLLNIQYKFFDGLCLAWVIN
jgi:phosphopantetheine--protein transferase-like protein